MPFGINGLIWKIFRAYIQRTRARRPKSKLLSTYSSVTLYVGGGGGSPNLIDANNPKIESATKKNKKQTK